MPRAPRTPDQAFVATLSTLSRRHPQIEGLVFWHDPSLGGTGWPDTPSQDLDPEEIPWFVEGLLPEGFAVLWRLISLPATPALPAALHLYLWEDKAPPPPDEPASRLVLETGQWPPA